MKSGRPGDDAKIIDKPDLLFTSVFKKYGITTHLADPRDPETLYVLNSPLLKSIDGGKTFQAVSIAHADQHDLWINPENPSNFLPYLLPLAFSPLPGKPHNIIFHFLMIAE